MHLHPEYDYIRIELENLYKIRVAKSLPSCLLYEGEEDRECVAVRGVVSW